MLNLYCCDTHPGKCLLISVPFTIDNGTERKMITLLQLSDIDAHCHAHLLEKWYKCIASGLLQQVPCSRASQRTNLRDGK